MIGSYRKAMTLYVEISQKSDEELIDIVRKWFDGKEADIMKAEFATRELEKRGYKPTITFEKEADNHDVNLFQA